MGGLERIGAQRDILGECPLWHAEEAALYWVDIRAPAIRRLDWASRALQSWDMPSLVGSIAFAADGRLLVALAERIALFDTIAGRLDTVAELAAPDGHRCNDGGCDRQGRFWVGTMHNVTRAAEGVLYRLDAQGLTPMLRGIRIPNALAWSPDGRTMYFADSLGHAIDAYAYDPATGTPGAARCFARTTPPGFPDGSTVDAEGYVWNAEFLAGRVVRRAPGGGIDRVIDMPVDRPTSCTFGGPELDILFITTTCQNMTEAQRAAAPLAGALFACRPGPRGLPAPFWQHPGSPA